MVSRSAGPLDRVVAAPDFVRWRRDDAGVVVEATVAEHVDPDHLSRLVGPWGDLWVRRQDQPVGSTVRVRILARDVSLALARETGSTLLNQLPVRVAAVEGGTEGDVTVRLESEGGHAPLLARITIRSARQLRVERGREVWARVKAVAVVA